MQNTNVENKCVDTKGEGGGWNELGDWDSHIFTHTRIYMKQVTIGTYCIAQGTLLSALWWSKWEGNPKKRGYVYTKASQVVLGVKNLAAKAGNIRDMGSIPGLGRSPGEGNGNPLQYSCLENPMDRGAWWVTVHRATKSQTQLKWLSTHSCTRITRSLCCSAETNTTW